MKRTTVLVSMCLVLGPAVGAFAGWVTLGDNMYADVPGNVGIGTTNPAAKLAVEGDIDANSVLTTFPTTHELLVPGFWGSVQGHYAKYLHFFTTTTPDGNFSPPSDTLQREAFGFLAGTLTEIGPLPSFYTTSTIGVYGEASTGSGIGVYGKGKIGVEGVGQEYNFYAAGPGINYASKSSIRWKRNVKAIENPLEKILELRGVSFDWDAAHGGKHDIGMIAEEVGKVLPEIVQYEDDVHACAMDYSKVTPLVLEAVKALKAEVDALREEIAEKNTQIAEQHQQILELTIRMDRMRSEVSVLRVQSHAGL